MKKSIAFIALVAFSCTAPVVLSMDLFRSAKFAVKNTVDYYSAVVQGVDPQQYRSQKAEEAFANFAFTSCTKVAPWYLGVPATTSLAAAVLVKPRFPAFIAGVLGASVFVLVHPRRDSIDAEFRKSIDDVARYVEK